VKLLLVLSLILTAALLLVSFVGAGSLAPNELGRIMILEYHKIDYPEERWTRTPENFRRDLETLYAKGYRLISLGDLLDRSIKLPAGTTPVVLTFDDSSPGQFRYIEANGSVQIDPKSGLGVLEAFIAEKPDFGRAATFYVLPGASKPNRLFNQPEYEGRKLQYLASHGYEIGNHTLWHANLAKYPEATVRAQVAEAQVWIQRHVPDYRTRTIALPHGAYPTDGQGHDLQPRRGADGRGRPRAVAVLAVVRSGAPAAHPGRRARARVLDRLLRQEPGRALRQRRRPQRGHRPRRPPRPPPRRAQTNPASRRTLTEASAPRR
jgi:peptidoglycan/xylan/chitin deacetylase (PgdA/CDA1 family)